MGEEDQRGSFSCASPSLHLVFREEFLQSRTQKGEAEKLSFCSLLYSWLLAGAMLLPTLGAWEAGALLGGRAVLRDKWELKGIRQGEENPCCCLKHLCGVFCCFWVFSCSLED